MPWQLPETYLKVMKEAAFRPPPVFEPAELATLQTFVTASGIRPEGPGGARFDLTQRPYLRALYAETRANPYYRLVIQKAAQTGLTVKLQYRALWLTSDSRKKINTALMFPTQSAVEDLQKSRFRPMMRSSEKMMRLTQGNVDSVSLVIVGVSTMRFRGMTTGLGVDSFPADVMLFDEVRLMDLASIERAQVRVTQSSLESPNGQRGIIELNSTAGFPDMDINKYFSRSTQNYWRTPCPNPGCPMHREGITMPLEWTSQKIIGERNGVYFYKCPRCDRPIPDDWLFREGFYRPEHPGADWEGYQFSQILNGNGFLQDLMRFWQQGDNRAEFFNSRLGLAYMDEDAIPATEERVLACATGTGMNWLEPVDLERDVVSIGIDQRATEFHCVVTRRGADGAFDLVDAHVVEGSGKQAVKDVVEYIRYWKPTIVVIDGEPSYGWAVDVARTFPKRLVYLADYVDERPNMFEWFDDTDKESIRRSSSENKYEFRVLIDRYKGIGWALGQFQNLRMRLPDASVLKARTQLRTLNGVKQTVPVIDEYLLHLRNIARATELKQTTLKSGEKINLGEFRQVFRHLALDPHFAHAHTYSLVGLARVGGTGSIWRGPGAGVSTDRPANQLDAVLPVGARPMDLAREAAEAKAKTCSNCKFARWLSSESGLCGHPNNATVQLIIKPELPKCPVWRRQKV